MNHESSNSYSILFRSTLVIVLVMMLPLVPILIYGAQLEDWLTENLLNNPVLNNHPVMSAIAIIVIMAVDIVLPAPSTGAMTVAGATFGLLTGWCISFVGLSLSCSIGYQLGRHFGMPLLNCMASQEEVQETARMIDLRGLWVLAGLRALPAIGEVSVMVASVYRMQRWRFWFAVSAGNAILALTYCSLGFFAGDSGWILHALIVSVMLPMLMLLVWLLLRRRSVKLSG